jgi:hypothetical protein
MREIQKKIFISYGRADPDIVVTRLIKDLTNLGYSVWFDRFQGDQGITPGADWEESIESGISAADYMVLLLTPNSVSRSDGYCHNEISYAIQLKKRIFPIMMEEVPLPIQISRLHYINFMDWKEGGRIQLNEKSYARCFSTLTDALAGRSSCKTDGDVADYENILYRFEQDYIITRYNSYSYKYIDRVTKKVMIFGDRKIRVFIKGIKEGRKKQSVAVIVLTGGPGSGKTIFASYLATRDPRIAGIHYCDAEHEYTLVTSLIFQSLAHQLATMLPEYASYLSQLKLVKEDVQRNEDGLFEKLFLGFRNCESINGRIYLVIDGVDSVTGADGNNVLALVISKYCESIPDWLGFILLFRCDSRLTSLLRRGKIFSLNFDIDFRRYIVALLGEGGIDYSASLSPLKKHFFDRCATNIQYGMEVLKEILGIVAFNSKLVDLLEIQNVAVGFECQREFPVALAGTYYRNFIKQFPDKSIYNEFRSLIQVILSALTPLPISILQQASPYVKHDISNFLNYLQPLFEILDTDEIYIHPSYREWIARRAFSNDYFVDISAGRRVLSELLYNNYKAAMADLPDDPEECVNELASDQKFIIDNLPIMLILNNDCDKLYEVLCDIRFMKYKSSREMKSELEAICGKQFEQTDGYRLLMMLQSIIERHGTHGVWQRLIFELNGPDV